MRTPARLWRTSKEGEFVLDSDPKAVTLAYGLDDEVDGGDLDAAKKALGKLVKAAEPAADKQADPPENKQADPPANKGAAKKATRPRRPARKQA